MFGELCERCGCFLELHSIILAKDPTIFAEIGTGILSS